MAMIPSGDVSYVPAEAFDGSDYQVVRKASLDQLDYGVIVQCLLS